MSAWCFDVHVVEKGGAVRREVGKIAWGAAEGCFTHYETAREFHEL